MPNKFHSQYLTTDGIHTSVALVFADSTARTSFVGASYDVGKIAKQTDTGSYWILSSIGPTAWIELTGVTPLTTKGDLFTHNGSGNARLAVGVNGYFLTADSTEATGLKWVQKSNGECAQYSNSSLQSTSGTLVLTVDSAQENNLGSLFDKPSATEIRTLFAGRVGVYFSVNGYMAANTRSFNVTVRKNTTSQAWTKMSATTGDRIERGSGVAGYFEFTCAVNDTFSLQAISPEAVLATFPIDNIRLTLRPVRID